MEITKKELEQKGRAAAAAAKRAIISNKSTGLAALVGLVLGGMKAGINRYIKPDNHVRAITKAVAGAAGIAAGHVVAKKEPGAGYGAVGGSAVVLADGVEELVSAAPAAAAPKAPDAGAVMTRIYGAPRTRDAGAVVRRPTDAGAVTRGTVAGMPVRDTAGMGSRGGGWGAR